MMTVNKQQTLQTGIYLLLHKHTISQSIRSLGKRRRGVGGGGEEGDEEHEEEKRRRGRGGGRRMRRRCEETGGLRGNIGLS